MTATVRPKALRSGMCVGLLAPASPPQQPDTIERAAARVQALGFVTRIGSAARDVHGYLAGDDGARARDLNTFFEDPDIDAIWCLRGGYGALRLLPGLDLDVIRAHPKVLIGYSDITALHIAIGQATGLVTFHGPMPSRDFSAYARAAFERVVGCTEPAGIVGAPADHDPAPRAVRGGRATGPLTGGNLTLLTRLMGTPHEPAMNGRILFIEDTGEPIYRIDGMLTQLRLSGKLARCAGIVVGHFTDADGGARPRLAMETVLAEVLGDLGVPVLWGLACGHVADQGTLPYGVVAELDADAGTLELLEPAVV